MLYTFGDKTGPIPLSQLDWNFAQIPNQALTANTVLNNSQANITSVGTLTGLSVAGNVLISGPIAASGSFTTAGNINSTAGISATNLYINNLGGAPAIVTGNLQVQGTLTSISSNNISTGNLTITVGNSVVDANKSQLNGAGIVVGATPTGNLVYNYNTNSFQSSLHVTPISNVAGLNLGAPNNYWQTVYTTAILMSGNLVAGNIAANTYTAVNILSSGYASIAGNVITDSSITAGGNIVTAGTLSAVAINAGSLSVIGTISLNGLTASGNLYSAGLTTGNAAMANVSTGNIINSGNIATAGLSATGAVQTDSVSATGTVVAGTVTASGNIVGGNLRTAGTVTATGNIVGGNLRTAGNLSVNNVSATGNVSGTYILGNGSQLTGLSTTATAVANPGGWSVTPVGNKLYFNFNGTDVGSLDSSGNFIVIGDVTGAGVP